MTFTSTDISNAVAASLASVPPARRASAWMAPTLAILAALLLAGSALMGWVAYQGARQADAFEAAPSCAGRVTAGCVDALPATVVRTRSTGGRSRTDYVTLSLPGRGQVEVTRSDSDGLFNELREGTPVQALVWNGKIVLLQGLDGRELATRDHPFSRVEDGLLAALFALYFGGLVGYLAFAARNRGLAYGRARRLEGLAGAYSLPCTLSASPAAQAGVPALIGGPMLIAALAAASPYAHPVSAVNTTAEEAIVGLWLLISVPIVALIRARSVVVDEEGLTIRSFKREQAVPFREMWALRRLRRSRSETLHIYSNSSPKPISLPLAWMGGHQRAILADAIVRHQPYVEMDLKSRQMLAGL